MRGFEAEVRTALNAGEVVDYSVAPVYSGTHLTPIGVSISAQGSRGLDIFVSILNRGLR